MGFNYKSGFWDLFDEAKDGDTENRDEAAGRSAAVENYPLLNVQGGVLKGLIGNSNFPGDFDQDYFVVDIKDGYRDGPGSVAPGEKIFVTLNSFDQIEVRYNIVGVQTEPPNKGIHYLDAYGPIGSTLVVPFDAITGNFTVPTTGLPQRAFIAFQVIDVSADNAKYSVHLRTSTSTFKDVIDGLSTDFSEPGYQFASGDFETTVNPDAQVGSVETDGLVSFFNNNKLINNGEIWSAALDDDIFYFGAYFTGNNSTIINKKGATIDGWDSGIGIYGNGAYISNLGTVGGGDDGYGIVIGEDATDVEIENEGTIEGGGGVVILADFGTIVFFINKGTLEAHTGSAIETDNNGRIHFTNSGKVLGPIDLTGVSQNDTIINKGTLNGNVSLGSGNDIFKGSGGSAAVVFGEKGNDTLTGGSKGDKLDGGVGKDVIAGAFGTDKLAGGTEADTFDFNNIKDSLPGAKRDTITDFKRGQDKIDVSDIAIKGKSKFTFIGDDKFSKTAGELRFDKKLVQGDVNGDGKADFEIHVNVSSLAKGDFVL